MKEFALNNIILFSLLVLILNAIIFHARPSFEKLAKIGILALILGLVASTTALILGVLSSSDTVTSIGFDEWGLTLRFDQLSLLMHAMVSIIGIVVIKFSKTYLEGESDHTKFLQTLALTIASVQLLVLSGSLINLGLFWILTSILLHKLIGFYKNRSAAIQASRKKFIVARISDICLVASFALIYLQFNTADLNIIFDQLQSNPLAYSGLYLNSAAIFLVLAAAIKSVQVPFHGWILEVMEAPTPVSALLHAGLLNAGPFLVIRFSHLIQYSNIAAVLLMIIAGISALYGTIVFPSQPSIKTSLAYSSIGHMGFSLMMCGMGLYAAALLHLIAHSFYKAHAFLSSGSAIDQHRLSLFYKKSESKVNLSNALTGFVITAGIFLLLSEYTGLVNFNDFQFNVLCAVIVSSVAIFSSRAMTKTSLTSLAKTIIFAAFILLSFLVFESGVDHIISGQIPVSHEASQSKNFLSIILLILFISTQVLTENHRFISNELVQRWNTHRRHGFYIHLVFNRLINPFLTK